MGSRKQVFPWLSVQRLNLFCRYSQLCGSTTPGSPGGAVKAGDILSREKPIMLKQLTEPTHP